MHHSFTQMTTQKSLLGRSFWTSLRAVTLVTATILSMSASSAWATNDNTGHGSSAQNQLKFVMAPEHGVIGISKAAVEQKREYILSVSMIPQFGSPTSHGNISRIITFEKRGDDIVMLESTKGQVVTETLPAKQIVAIFKGAAADEHEGFYLLKWDHGMSRMFFSADWYASDFEGKDYSIGERSISVRANDTYVDDVKWHPDTETVEIRQILQLAWPTGVHFPNYEARYYLREYRPNPSFVAKETTNFKRVGYFEANPQIETGTGRTSVKISKWSIEKPITYYISSNTPPEFVEAVRDGILYWNKAFGREVIRAEVAPQGVTAPDPNYNIVQWVPWDLAGSAYADAQMDPRTGEILHAQVYLTSAFAAISKSRLHFILENLKGKSSRAHAEHDEHGHDHGDHAGEHNHIDMLPMPKEFKASRLCNYSMNEAILSQLENMANDPNATDADVLRMTQNYIREVVAHEVGHTLGLRHNFAGTMASNLTFDQRDQLFNKLLVDPKNADTSRAEVTSSVMAYTSYRDAVIEGQRIKDSKDAFAYDKLAIQFAYLENKGEHEIDRTTAPIFCTDTHVDKYGDCRVFTSGSSPIANAMWEQNQVLKELAATIVGRYMAAKAPADARDKMALDEVSFNPRALALTMVMHYRNQLKWLASNTRSALVERPEARVDGVNADKIWIKKYKWVLEQITSLGGIDSVFFRYLPTTATKSSTVGAPLGLTMLSGPIGMQLHRRLEEHLKNEKVKNFIGGDGQKHQFSDQELALIAKTGHDYIKKFENEFMMAQLDALAEAKVDIESSISQLATADGSLQSQFEERLREVAETVLLTQSSESYVNGVVTYAPDRHPNVVVAADAYSHEVRLKAAKLLSAKMSPTKGWSMVGRRHVTDQLLQRVKGSLGEDLRKINEAQVAQPLREWVMQQKEIITLLAAEPGCADLLASPVVAKSEH